MNALLYINALARLLAAIGSVSHAALKFRERKVIRQLPTIHRTPNRFTSLKTHNSGVTTMAIQSNTARVFGARSNTAAAAFDDRAKAQFWLNVGYVSNVKDEDGTYRFVSLAQGIPLDSIESLPVNSRNQSFAMFRQAQNELRDDLLTEAKQLKPGEDMIFEAGPSGLTFQLRRVQDEQAAPTGENPFRRRFSAAAE